MDAVTGKPLDGDAHLAQSIGDILSTPIGTRVCLRDYGSALSELVDAPLTALTRIRVFAATAVALARWEPRLRLTRVALAAPAGDGTARLEIEGERTDVPRTSGLAALTLPLRFASA